MTAMSISSVLINWERGNYRCPICPAVNEIENEDAWIKQADVVYKDLDNKGETYKDEIKTLIRFIGKANK